MHANIDREGYMASKHLSPKADTNKGGKSLNGKLIVIVVDT